MVKDVPRQKSSMLAASPFLRRQSTITHISEKETDHLVNKMVNFLQSSGDRKQHRDVRKSSFWGFDRSKPQKSDSLQDMGTVVELQMEQFERVTSMVARSHTNSDGKSLFIGKTCTFDPNSLYRQSWDILFVMTSLIYTALRVPYAIAFDIDEFESPDIWFALNRLIDFVFIMDMMIIMMTAIKDGRKMVTNHKSIFIHYLKGWFIFDLAASVPIDLILWIITSNASFTAMPLNESGSDHSDASRSAKLIRVIKIFRTFRILRLIKMKRIVITLEIFLGLNFSVMSILKYAVMVFLLGHLIACGFIAVSSTDGWMKPFEGETQERQYLTALYWAFTTMTTMGYGDIAAMTPRERLWSVACMIIGGVAFTYAITRIVHIVTSMGNAQKNLAEQLENVSEWASYHEFPDSLMTDIKTYLHYKNSRSYFDEKAVLDGLSVSLKQKVLNLMFENAMKRVELFSNCSPIFLTELMTRMKSEFAAPFSLIISENAVADSMYIIRRGFCAVYKGHEREDVQSAIIMGPGQAFGEIALLADNTTRTANVVALEWTDLAIIKRDCFDELLVMFPNEKFKMHKYVEGKLNQLKQDQSCSRSRMRSETVLKFKESTMNYGLDSDDDDDDEDTDSTEEENGYREWLKSYQQTLETQSYKDPLNAEKEEHMKVLEKQYAKDVQLQGLNKLLEKVRSMKYQWLMHVDADERNREYIAQLSGNEEEEEAPKSRWEEVRDQFETQEFKFVEDENVVLDVLKSHLTFSEIHDDVHSDGDGT